MPIQFPSARLMLHTSKYIDLAIEIFSLFLATDMNELFLVDQ